MESSGGISNTFKYVLMVGMVLTGAFNTIIFKAQDHMKVNGEYYNHPFIQAFTMFFGEFLCLTVLLVRRWGSKTYQYEEAKAIAEAEAKGLDTKISEFWLLIPAGCDTLTSILQLAGLVYVDQSIYQMMRGGVIIVTAILSIIVLGKKFYSHHYLGVGLTILGILLVGYAAATKKKEDTEVLKNDETVALGLTLLLISLLTNGILFVSEEKLFSKFYIEPLKMVGLEGCWGMLLCAIIIPIAQLIPCKTDPKTCPWGYIEDAGAALAQWGASGALLASVLAGSVILASFNFFGVSVTKNINALTRSILDVTRTVLVWIYALAIGTEKFLWLQLAGFILLVLGNFIYTEILAVPGFDSMLKRNQEKNTSSLLSSEENS